MDFELTDTGLENTEYHVLIESEDLRQLTKWGDQTHDMFRWLAILVEEVGELSEAMLNKAYWQGSYRSIEEEAAQVATVAIKIAVMAEQLKAR